MEENKAKKSFTIHDLPTSERPRERMQKYGAANLSSGEILALILERGIKGESVTVTVQRLFSRFGNLKGIAAASVEELSTVRGIKLAKACKIKAAFTLAERINDGYSEAGTRTVVKTPEDVFNLLKVRLKGQQKESFWGIFLNTRNQMIKAVEISIGSLDTSIVHPREVFKEAVSASASSIIVAHNHPSGNPQASEEDIGLTKRLAEAGKIVGIDLLDHIVIGDNTFISLKREGLF